MYDAAALAAPPQPETAILEARTLFAARHARVASAFLTNATFNRPHKLQIATQLAAAMGGLCEVRQSWLDEAAFKLADASDADEFMAAVADVAHKGLAVPCTPGCTCSVVLEKSV